MALFFIVYYSIGIFIFPFSYDLSVRHLWSQEENKDFKPTLSYNLLAFVVNTSLWPVFARELPVPTLSGCAITATIYCVKTGILNGIFN